jgi:hypothetical protein
VATSAVAAAVEAWIVELIPGMDGKTYDYHASQKSHPFPDAAIEVDEVRQGDTPRDVGMDDMNGAPQGWEQAVYRSYTIRIVLITDEDPPAAAEDDLREWGDLIQDSLLFDRTLGGRVQWVNRAARCDFTPPFVEFEDGARGRMMTAEIQVGEAIPFED